MPASAAGSIRRSMAALRPAAQLNVQPSKPPLAAYPVLGIGYFLTAAFSIHLNSEVGNIASLWISGGILLTALIWYRQQSWPWILACAAAAHAAADLMMGGTLAVTLGTTILDMLEPLAVAIALRRFGDGRPWFLSVRWIGLFGASCILASLASATLGSAWLAAVGVASFWTSWKTWATADVLGYFLVTPFLLSWMDPFFRESMTRRKTAEAVALTVVIAIIAGLVFIGAAPFPFVIFPFLVVLALRGGLLGATTGLLVLAVIGSWFTLGGSGPIAMLASIPSNRVLVLQLYMLSAVIGTQSIALIMTQRRRLADGLTKQTIISRAALDNMAQGLCMFDIDRRLVICNDRYRDLHQLPSTLCAPGTPLGDILKYQSQHGIYHGTVEDFVEALNFTDGETAFAEIILSGGQVVEIKRRRLSGGGWVATHEDVTERQQNTARLSYLAEHDSLTDIYNRSYFSDRLHQALVSCRRGEHLALHSVDLDRFKEVNDTLGHPAGDEILQQVAERLQTIVRECDLVARVGGDEFAILQQNVKGPKQAIALAERALTCLRKPFDVVGHPVVVVATIGIALSTDEPISAVDLMKKSDLALYRCKQEGRDGYRLFERGMDAMLQAQRRLEQELSRALPNGELLLVYQPILDLESKRITAFEALARWNHPTRGLIAPAEFISVAEDRGLIISIGEWVLREACEEAARWPDDVGVAVNLSPVQFKAEGLVDAVAAALAASGLAPSRLELEVTESVLLLDSSSVLRTFKKLRALGVKLAMDDFGTGYSSLSYLRTFQFDKPRDFSSAGRCRRPKSANSCALETSAISSRHSSPASIRSPGNYRGPRATAGCGPEGDRWRQSPCRSGLL
ncbi:MAG: EAL domain-containing protein [Sphingomicrobium sp.]